jgi:L-alanine-DL-glutamate epimerase-like enolase superfamily enzyme
MKITGYRTLKWTYDRGRRLGDANGVTADGISTASYLFLETDEGITGIAPAAPGDVVRLFPVLEGQDPRGTVGMWKRMSDAAFKTGVQGDTFDAMCALDAAMWDIKAKAAGEPLWRALGASEPRVKGYASGLDMGLTDDELAAFYQRYADLGFDGGKLKVGLDIDADLRRLGIVNDILKRNAKRPYLMIDSNEYWSPKQAIRYISMIEEQFDLAWAEEPARRWDYRGLRKVSEGVRTAVATGENINGIDEYYPLIHNEAVDVVQFGTLGVTSYFQVAHFAEAYELPVSVIGAPGSAMAHVAAALPNHLMMEVKDLAPPPGVKIDNRFEDGFIVIGDSPGWGITVDEQEVARLQAKAKPMGAAGFPKGRRKGAGLYVIPPHPGETGL